MPQITPSQARVVDRVFSTIAQGYMNRAMVAQALFPTVPVTLRGGNVLTFGKEAFMLYSNTRRAPGENTKRVMFGYSGAPYALLDYSLEATLPIEVQQEAMNGPRIDLAEASINGVQAIMALRLEKQAADIARTAASYAASNKVTLAGTSQWSDQSGVSDPISVVETAREAIRASTGKRPNTMVIGAAVMAKLKQHPKVIDRMKYTGRDIATTELLSSLFDIQNVLVGDSIYATDAGVFTDVWGKDVVIAYTELGTVRDMGAPSYGYTYQLEDTPLVEEPYYDRNAKSWIFPVTRTEAPVMAAPLAGYLITNAVA